MKDPNGLHDVRTVYKWMHSKETVINKNVFTYNNKKYEQETLF